MNHTNENVICELRLLCSVLAIIVLVITLLHGDMQRYPVGLCRMILQFIYSSVMSRIYASMLQSKVVVQHRTSC